jgi:hypothetical protein
MFLLLLRNSITAGDKVLLFSQVSGQHTPGSPLCSQSLSTLELLGTILQLDWGEMLAESCSSQSTDQTASQCRFWKAGNQFLVSDTF